MMLGIQAERDGAGPPVQSVRSTATRSPAALFYMSCPPLEASPLAARRPAPRDR
jgi:hypothetical protein